MLALNFYPQFDVYHATFRAISISLYCESLPVEAYRIFDYFSLHPFDLGIIRLRGSRAKKLAMQFDNQRPYRWTSDPGGLFLRMSDYQTMALNSLFTKDIVIKEHFKNGTLTLNKKKIPNDLLTSASEYIENIKEILDLLLDLLKDYGINGEGSLKDRSNLMNFRYDVRQHEIIN